MSTVATPAAESTIDSKAEQTSELIRELFLNVVSKRFPPTRTGALAHLMVLRVAAEQYFVGPGHITHRFDIADEIGIRETELDPIRATAVASGLLQYEPGSYHKLGCYWVIDPKTAPPPTPLRPEQAEPSEEFVLALLALTVEHMLYVTGQRDELKSIIDEIAPNRFQGNPGLTKRSEEIQRVHRAGKRSVDSGVDMDCTQGFALRLQSKANLPGSVEKLTKTVEAVLSFARRSMGSDA